MQCLGQNYAYNEASYFLVRLLQEFDTFTLAPEFQPAGSLPPPEWKSRKGRQAVEQIWPAAALTLYIKVRLIIMLPSTLSNIRPGWYVGSIWQSCGSNTIERPVSNCIIMYFSLGSSKTCHDVA